jgi:DNA-binding transcriptional LysR family regulator
VTQPALTKQIQALETRVGGTLFRRGRHGAEPTALGRVLLPDAREAVERLDAFTLRARRLTAAGAARLAVGFGLSTIEIAPRTVAEFRRRRPGVQVTLDDMPSARQVERLRRGELDAGFVRLPVDEDMPVIELGGDELMLAIPEGIDPTAGAEALIRELGLVTARRSSRRPVADRPRVAATRPIPDAGGIRRVRQGHRGQLGQLAHTPASVRHAGPVGPSPE